MQGLADGYFVLPYTIGQYLAQNGYGNTDNTGDAFKEAEQDAQARIDKLLSIKGKRTPDSFHREMGKLVWDKCGMARSEDGLKEAIEKIPAIRAEFVENVAVVSDGGGINVANLNVPVAWPISWSSANCSAAMPSPETKVAAGTSEKNTKPQKAKPLRDDENHCHVAVWEHQGQNAAPKRHQEELTFDNVKLTQRSYK